MSMVHSKGLILLDVPEGTDESLAKDFLEGLGHPVLVCHGPEPGTLCPILRGESCSMLDAAHGVMFRLDLDRPQHRAILRRYRQILRSDVPVRVILPAGQAERYSELITWAEVRIGEPSVGDLDGFAAEVEAADRAEDDTAA